MTDDRAATVLAELELELKRAKTALGKLREHYLGHKRQYARNINKRLRLQNGEKPAMGTPERVVFELNLHDANTAVDSSRESLNKAEEELDRAAAEANRISETISQIKQAARTDETIRKEFLQQKRQDEGVAKLKGQRSAIATRILGFIGQEKLHRRITSHDADMKFIFCWDEEIEGACCDITVHLRTRPGKYLLRVNNELDIVYVGYERLSADKRDSRRELV